MSANLSILIGEFGATDRGSNELISEWASANILQTVARVDLESEGVLDLPKVLFSDGVSVQEEGLFDLLTARRWRHVTVIALREANLGTLSLDRFNKELAVLEMVRGAFADSNDTTFRSCTCSIIETKGVILIKNGLPKATAKFTVTLKDFGIGGLLIKMVADQVDIEVVANYQ